MTYKVPVDFTIDATDLENAKDNFDMFLKFCYKEYGKQFGVLDYELPVGYPIECNVH